MFEELRRLLESYDFLRRAVAEHGDRFPPSTLQTLIADRDKLPLQNLPVISCNFPLGDDATADAVAGEVRRAVRAS